MVAKVCRYGTASFSENQVAFCVDKTNGGDLTFFIIDNDTYGYSSDSYKGRIEVGRLVSNEDVRFITARDNYAIASYAAVVSEEALGLWENYENDKLAIIESPRSVNGYEFILRTEQSYTTQMREKWQMKREAFG